MFVQEPRVWSPKVSREGGKRADIRRRMTELEIVIDNNYNVLAADAARSMNRAQHLDFGRQWE